MASLTPKPILFDSKSRESLEMVVHEGRILMEGSPEKLWG